MADKRIRVFGARQHNLQNIDIDLPIDRLVVVTGLSGSGKSSLAFDTIYAEGQRKYVESLSVHARLFLEQIGKPDVDRIEGLPPTIAIEQLASSPNPRSTVATTTEIHDFLRLLFARCGRPHCPNCQTPLVRSTVDEVVASVLARPAETRVMVLAPLARGADGDLGPLARRIQREGFVRARVNGALVEARELSEASGDGPRDIDVVVDRLVLKDGVRHRLADAVELAFGLSEGRVVVARATRERAADGWTDETYSQHHSCTQCGFVLPEIAPRSFSFNSPYGACPDCDGIGVTRSLDPELVIADDALPLSGGAIAPWQGASKRMSATYTKLAQRLCAAFDVPPATPFRELPEPMRSVVLFGSGKAPAGAAEIEFEGVLPNLERRLAAAGNGDRSRFAAYMSERSCAACDGARLGPAARGVRIEEHSIVDVARLSIAGAADWFEALDLPGEAGTIARPIVHEVRRRLRFMNEVGLGYLTLDRPSVTLSGGEAQRIRLATQLGSGLVGVCYVLDEPTIGLHQRDNQRLLASIRRLVEMGNSVIVVEHDEDVIRAADYLIDIGPGAGLHGGQVIAQGAPDEVIAQPQSITARYLRGEYEIRVPEERRALRRGETLQVVGAAANNLKGITAQFPLGLFIAVTGVSGSGKSTLVNQTLLPALRRRLLRSRETPGAHERLIGAHKVDRVIAVDQAPIGRSPRSNPATYTGVFDEIRRLYARTKEARVRGYTASRFSFNAKGGRCEACQGQGVRRIEMHFLPDVFVECEVCRGTRYNHETLEVRYRGKSIADVLNMRVEDALKFFDSFARIKAGVQALADVGLGYLRLGQPSNTLSGGEAQRVKLAGELAKGGGSGHTLYVMDEPTTGLHFADIDTLLSVLNRLVDHGNTVIVIEHNLDVIKTCDWVIDLGPEGGDAGGEIVVCGPPEAVADDAASITGRFLRPKLG